jgi:hypothetical protein
MNKEKINAGIDRMAEEAVQETVDRTAERIRDKLSE